jgi:hypothetical protein
MRTKEEMMIMLDEIFSEIGKLEQEILSNQKKGIKNDLAYMIERAKTISALTAKSNLLRWILKID